MNDIYQFLSIHKCDCMRPWCDYFAPGVGENGTSFSKKETKELLRDAKKLIKVLERELKK